MSEVRAEDPNAWSLDDDDVAVVYIDGIDYQHHLLGASHGTRVFPTIASIKEHRSCVVECGIIEIEIRVRRWVQPQNLHGDSGA